MRKMKPVREAIDIAPLTREAQRKQMRFSALDIKCPDGSTIPVWIAFLNNSAKVEQDDHSRRTRLRRQAFELINEVTGVMTDFTHFYIDVKGYFVYTVSLDLYEAWKRKYPTQPKDDLQARNDTRLSDIRDELTFSRLFLTNVEKGTDSSASTIIERLSQATFDGRHHRIGFDCESAEKVKALTDFHSALLRLSNLPVEKEVDKSTESGNVILSPAAYQECCRHLKWRTIAGKRLIWAKPVPLTVFYPVTKYGRHYYFHIRFETSTRNKIKFSKTFRSKLSHIVSGLGGDICIDHRYAAHILCILTPEQHQTYYDALPKSAKTYYSDTVQQQFQVEFFKHYPHYLPPYEPGMVDFRYLRYQAYKDRLRSKPILKSAEMMLVKCAGLMTKPDDCVSPLTRVKLEDYFSDEYRVDAETEAMLLLNLVRTIEFTYKQCLKLHGWAFTFSEFIIQANQMGTLPWVPSQGTMLRYDAETHHVFLYSCHNKIAHLLYNRVDESSRSYTALLGRYLSSLEKSSRNDLTFRSRCQQFTLILTHMSLMAGYYHRLDRLQQPQPDIDVLAELDAYESDDFAHKLSIFAPNKLLQMSVLRQSHLYVAKSGIEGADQGLYICAPMGTGKLVLKKGSYVTWFQGEVYDADTVREQHPDKVSHACPFGLTACRRGGQVIVQPRGLKSPSAGYVNHGDGPFESVPIESKLGVIAMAIRLKADVRLAEGETLEIVFDYKTAAQRDHHIPKGPLYKPCAKLISDHSLGDLALVPNGKSALGWLAKENLLIDEAKSKAREAKRLEREEAAKSSKRVKRAKAAVPKVVVAAHAGLFRTGGDKRSAEEAMLGALPAPHGLKRSVE